MTVRYRLQPTEPTWPDWSEPNTADPTTYIPVGKVGDNCGPLIIQQLRHSPTFTGEAHKQWEVLEPSVALDWEGQANEAECRALAAAFLAAADKIAEITATDNDYPLEME